MTIDELEWLPHPLGSGERALVTFANGYGASVIRGGPFYTKAGTYEIGVLGPNGRLTYDTPITDDVLGYLSEDAANRVLAEIEALPWAADVPAVVEG